MNIFFRFFIFFFVSFGVLMFYSCTHQDKTTESIIENQSDYDITISFNDGADEYIVKSGNKKTVSVEDAEYPDLTFPFVSDTVIVKLSNNKKLYFSKSRITEEDNMFDEYNWTYVTYTSCYTKATYTFTNQILEEMDEMQ